MTLDRLLPSLRLCFLNYRIVPIDNHSQLEEKTKRQKAVYSAGHIADGNSWSRLHFGSVCNHLEGLRDETLQTAALGKKVKSCQDKALFWGPVWTCL